MEIHKQGNDKKIKKLNQSASEYITSSFHRNSVCDGDYFQKFIHNIEKQQLISQLFKIKDKENKRFQKQVYQNKKCILPLNLKNHTESAKKKAEASIHLQMSKISKNPPQSFIGVKPNSEDIQGIIEEKKTKLPIMLKKNKRWKIKWREEEKNMGALKNQEIKINKIFLMQKKQKYPFKNLDLNLFENKKTNSLHSNLNLKQNSTQTKHYIKGLSSSFSIKKKILKTKNQNVPV